MNKRDHTSIQLCTQERYSQRTLQKKKKVHLYDIRLEQKAFEHVIYTADFNSSVLAKYTIALVGTRQLDMERSSLGICMRFRCCQCHGHRWSKFTDQGQSSPIKVKVHPRRSKFTHEGRSSPKKVKVHR
ncbi:hypothetical protein BaRGS_00028364 [Batillaria attramentaria]|uniref:Uncharacterized protein n=1 Tax=Batillaria attramentaria TaxID=370345 RepID=A0ABD0K0T2_9CAEN